MGLGLDKQGEVGKTSRFSSKLKFWLDSGEPKQVTGQCLTDAALLTTDVDTSRSRLLGHQAEHPGWRG
jgi:hypothetical protein